MIEFVLWLLFGVLSGWVGYLLTRRSEHASIAPYMVIGVIGAVLGGFVTRDFGSSAGEMAISATSLLTALLTSVLCVMLIGFFGRTSPN